MHEPVEFILYVRIGIGVSAGGILHFGPCYDITSCCDPQEPFELIPDVKNTFVSPGRIPVFTCQTGFRIGRTIEHGKELIVIRTSIVATLPERHYLVEIGIIAASITRPAGVITMRVILSDVRKFDAPLVGLVNTVL